MLAASELPSASTKERKEEGDFVLVSTPTSMSPALPNEEKSPAIKTWVYYKEDMAISRILYDEVGMAVFAPAEQAHRIHTFDLPGSFSLAGETFLYGEKRTIQGCDLLLHLSLPLDEDSVKKAKELNTPILIMHGNEFSMYGDRQGNGEWDYTPMTRCHDSLKKLPFKEGIAKRSHPQFTQLLIEVLKEGHAAFDKEIEGSVESFAKADALMQQLQAVAYGNEPRSNKLLALLKISYNAIEKNVTQYWDNKKKRGEIAHVVFTKPYHQKQNCYQTILSILTIVYSYTEAAGNTRVIYRTSRSSAVVNHFKPTYPKADLSPLPKYVPHYKTSTRAVPFLPLRMIDDPLPNGLADNIAVRIYPLEIVMGEKIKYSLNAFFTRFFFSYSISGSSFVGKLADGTEIPLIHPINVPAGQQIVSIENKDPDFFALEQFKTVEIMALIMGRLGGQSFQVACHLRWFEDLIMGVLALCSGKITLPAFDMLIRTTKTMKDNISKKLTDFFSNITNRTFIIISPFDNLIGDALENNTNSFAMSLLKQLKLDRVKQANEEEILEHSLKALTTNSKHMDHVEIWESFIHMTKGTKDHMWTFEKMFAMVNVIAMAIAGRFRPSFGLCCIELFPKMPTMELANIYLKKSQQYNSILCLILLPLCVALNACDDAQQQKKYEGSNSRYRDTPQQGAYHLVNYPLFFRQALRNGDGTAPMTVQAVLSEEDKLQKAHVTPAPH